VDEGLVRHHEAQIFPLMRRRHLFSGSENFVLYDFFSGDYVNEDVFAYSNRRGEEKALVVYHNRYSETSGWIRNSVSKKERDASGQENLVRTTLGEALGIGPENRNYFRFRDFRTGLEYLRHGQELCQKGLFLQLGFYQYYVFLNFQEIVDKYGSDREHLISILHDIQSGASDNSLHCSALQDLSRIIDVPLADIVGTASFYTMFSLTPRGRHIIRLCESPQNGLG